MTRYVVTYAASVEMIDVPADNRHSANLIANMLIASGHRNVSIARVRPGTYFGANY